MGTIEKHNILTILEKAKGITNWELYLFSYDHKVKPDEFISYNFEFIDATLQIEEANSKIKLFNNKISKDENVIVNYTDGNTAKTSIEHIDDLADSLFAAVYTNFKTAIANPDNTSKLTSIKPKAYVLYGTHGDIPVFLITKKNPISTFTRKKKGPLMLNERKIEQTKQPQLAINGSFDAIIYGNKLYASNLGFEEIFNVHSMFAKNRDAIVAGIGNLNIIKDFAAFKKTAGTKQQARIFSSYDNSILIDEEKVAIVVAEGGFDFQNGQFILNDKKTAQRLIKILCRKVALDLFTKETVEVPSQTSITHIE